MNSTRHFFCALLLCIGAHAARAEEVTLFAAASLVDALKEVGKRWEQASGHTLRSSLAASSTLARQIENGAPAQLFISADEQWMDYLAEGKLVAPESRVDLLGNRLVLVVPAAKPASVALEPGFDLAGLLKGGRLAVGDPAHVPAGRYAQQALTKLGAWPTAEPLLARAETVRAALVLVKRGEAPAGIVYATDAKAAASVKVAGVFPASSHAAIVYPLAAVAGKETPASRSLREYLQSKEALAVFQSYGFSVLPKR